MAKITLKDGTVIEGTVEELIAYKKGLNMTDYQPISGRKPQAGDFIRFHKDDRFRDVRADRYYEITGVSQIGYEFTDDAGEENAVGSERAGVTFYERT